MRFSNHHPALLSETSGLAVEGRYFKITSHVNGIALDEREHYLYFSPLSGHILYRVPVQAFFLPGCFVSLCGFVPEPWAIIPASDGMLFDKKGNLYLTGVEAGRIWTVSSSKTITPLFEDLNIAWPDSLASAGSSLYVTASNIHCSPRDFISSIG